MFLFRFFLFLIFSVSVCEAAHLSIVQPIEQRVDQNIEIQIQDLAPFQKIELKAEAEDKKGEIWSSHATFQGDDQGIATLNKMNLFSLMTPSSSDASASFKCKNDIFEVTLKLYVEGKLEDEKSVIFYLKTPNVERIEVKEDGVVGALFIPTSKKPLTLIITLSGSNGGLSENRAKLLASNGFAVFALGYFGVDGLPSKLQDIPLEYFEKAFAWIKTQQNIDASHIGLFGVSRGAELSLILGSLFPDSIQAIVAIVPSSVVYGGLSETPVNAWSYQSKPVLPFAPVPQTDFTHGKGKTALNPANTRESFLAGMQNQKAFKAAAIPVEKIRCPILLISGGDDQMWPSSIYANQIIERLKAHKSPIFCHHLYYPDAGHGFTIPNLPIAEPTYYHPVGELWFSMGGTREHDAEASADAWPKLIDFFHKTLNSAP